MFCASGFIARATSYETGLEGHVSIDAYRPVPPTR